MIHLPPSLLCINATALPTDVMQLPVKEGILYAAKELRKCKCGETFVHAGFMLDPSQHHITCNCGEKFHDGIWWLDIKRFRLPGQSAAPQLEITFTQTITRTVTIKVG